MGRHCTEVTTLHGFTIEELQEFAAKAPSNYTRSMVLAVIMRYQGIHPDDIMKTLGKSRPTILAYIHGWNETPFNLKDHRGNNVPSKLTDEIVDDITDLVINKTPRDFGYEHSTWTSDLLSKYIAEYHGEKFCPQWIRKLLKSQGFSYKRGMYEPTKGDPLLQEQFKKNG